MLPDIVDETNNHAHAEAIDLLRKIGALMGRHHQRAAYADYLAALRAQFRPKRNFIKLLDELIRNGAG